MTCWQYTNLSYDLIYNMLMIIYSVRKEILIIGVKNGL